MSSMASDDTGSVSRIDFIKSFFEEASQICAQIDLNQIEKLVQGLHEIRETGGRLFFLGVGGSAGNASHAVNDFRKLCGIETYTPTDNVSELTARTNDEGWETVFVEWLKVSKLCKGDAIFILSVGGGNAEKNVSANLISSIKLAKNCGAKVFGIVGREDGYPYKEADVCVLIPTINDSLVTPHSEAFQSVVWHCLVSHPDLQVNQTKW